jgi:hypothetical protein
MSCSVAQVVALEAKLGKKFLERTSELAGGILVVLIVDVAIL